MNSLRYLFLIYCSTFLLVSCNSSDTKKNSGQNEYKGNELTAMNFRLSKGWNTWNSRSVLSHVLLPKGFSVNLQLISRQSGDTLKEALIGRSDYGRKEHVIAGPRSYDGSFTDLNVKWQDINVRVQSADRSQPPVGSFIVKEIYKRYKQKWFLQVVFDELLTWNRWRAANRDFDRYLVHGSDLYDYGNSKYRSATESGKMKAAKWESGMDNSPMWNDAVFDSTSHRMLLAKVPYQRQAERRMKEHFFNPLEFRGEFIMPAISRNDPAYKDNKTWISERHLYENYNAETGQGDDSGMSDKFYHWGALLGFIKLIEEGYVPSPQLPVKDMN
jgi:hypothetical protein